MLKRTCFLTLATVCLLLTNATAAEVQAEPTQTLVAVLQSNAPFFDKARACQQLGEFGDAQAVPALAALLSDERLSAYARSGLEGIPDSSAAEALRTAAGTLKGNLLVGVVNSLGVLRDAKAVGRLKQLTDDPASGVAEAALLALGRISTDEAIQVLRQALATGPEAMQAETAAACLLAAEKQMTDGHADAAVSLYDTVRNVNVPLSYRAAATRGAIVARGSNGVPLLIEQLQSNERSIRNVALLTIREIPSDPLASALNAEVSRASVELQIQLLTALADCHNPQSLPVLQAKAASEDTAVRQTALTVLGQIGSAAQAGVLLQAVAANRSTEESAIALNGLRRMAGTTVDADIIQALELSKVAIVRLHLIRLLEQRAATIAVGELLQQAADPDTKISVAALHALQSLAGPGELASLIALTKSAKDEAVREAAENAVVGVGTRSGNAAFGNEVVLAELKQATDPIARCSWIRILVSLGDAKALPIILATTKDADAAVAATAIEQLARWPDAAPIDELLAVAQAGTDPVQRERAVASAIQLATAAADERQRPDATIVQWFQQAGRLARTLEDRRHIISGLGRLKHIESFQLLVPYLDDPALQNEAAVAVVQIAPALRLEDPAALREALEKIMATTKNQDLRSQAAKIAGTIPSQALRTALFDGRSLAGWEGDTNVWRVRDGVIVGGSLNGNPRNEFLATVKSYSNFVLRLEYKLVGTEGFVNGGVQFRSVRVQQPANEMCGFQADIGAAYSGCLYDESRRNKMLARPPEELIKRLEKPGDWNRYEVRCAGPRIQLFLNGERTVDYTETDAALPLDGLIALQIHGNCKAEISFRNLTVEDLSYAVATRAFGLAKTRWKVIACSSENTEAEDERAVLAIDGDPNTFWHTRWNGGNPGHPHHLAVDMGQAVEATGLAYLPRQDGRHGKGVIGEYEFYVSQTGQAWGEAVAKGSFDRIELDASGRVVLLTRPVTARYFKLVSLNAPNNEPYAGAAEVDVLGKPTPK